jgi:hypothetical protein
VGSGTIAKGHRYLTIVLNLDSGAVVFVGDGKGAKALKPFWKRLRSSKAKIEAVALDMAPADCEAVTTNLPEAKIVLARFHVMKLFNEKLSDLRRPLEPICRGRHDAHDRGPRVGAEVRSPANRLRSGRLPRVVTDSRSGRLGALLPCYCCPAGKRSATSPSFAALVSLRCRPRPRSSARDRLGLRGDQRRFSFSAPLTNSATASGDNPARRQPCKNLAARRCDYADTGCNSGILQKIPCRLGK